MIGDNDLDVEAGHAAGIQGIKIGPEGILPEICAVIRRMRVAHPAIADAREAINPRKISGFVIAYNMDKILCCVRHKSGDTYCSKPDELTCQLYARGESRPASRRTFFGTRV